MSDKSFKNTELDKYTGYTTCIILVSMLFQQLVKHVRTTMFPPCSQVANGFLNSYTQIADFTDSLQVVPATSGIPRLVLKNFE